MLGCAHVASQAACDAFGGAFYPGQTCVAGTAEDQEMAVYGRCNGLEIDGFSVLPPTTDLGTSNHTVTPLSVTPGGSLDHMLSIANTGTGLALATVTAAIPAALDLDPGSVVSSGARQAEIHTDEQGISIVWAGCLPPNGEVFVTYRTSAPNDAAVGEAILLAVRVDDLLAETQIDLDLLATIIEPLVPDDVAAAARRLAWESGQAAMFDPWRVWSVSEFSPQERCAACGGAPMCTVCMEYDLGVYEEDESLSAKEGRDVRKVTRYLRTATQDQYATLASIYWTSYWDGRHSRNRPD